MLYFLCHGVQFRLRLPRRNTSTVAGGVATLLAGGIILLPGPLLDRLTVLIHTWPVFFLSAYTFVVVRRRCHPPLPSGKVNPDMNHNLFPNPNLLFSDWYGQIFKRSVSRSPLWKKSVDTYFHYSGVGIYILLSSTVNGWTPVSRPISPQSGGLRESDESAENGNSWYDVWKLTALSCRPNCWN